MMMFPSKWLLGGRVLIVRTLCNHLSVPSYRGWNGVRP